MVSPRNVSSTSSRRDKKGSETSKRRLCRRKWLRVVLAAMDFEISAEFVLGGATKRIDATVEQRDEDVLEQVVPLTARQSGELSQNSPDQRAVALDQQTPSRQFAGSDLLQQIFETIGHGAKPARTTAFSESSGCSKFAIGRCSYRILQLPNEGGSPEVFTWSRFAKYYGSSWKKRRTPAA